MIQVADIRELTKEDIQSLLDITQGVLKKRVELHQKYSRGANQSKVMYSNDDETSVVPFEKFIVDLATGYLSGKPNYTVADTQEEDLQEILKDLLDKEPREEDYKKKMEMVIKYIADYNDDETENHDLIHDLLELTACYEILYENEENEIVYAKYDPLQTVAIWDYNVPANLVGLIRTWTEKNLAGKEITKIELTSRDGTRTYDMNGTEITETDNVNHNWGDVPAICVEQDFSIFEPCEDIIGAYQQLIQNTRNTYQYNDSDCKLKINGYSPMYPLINADGTPNADRQKEDQLWMDAKTIYCGEDGDVSWITKQIDSGGVTTILKTYIDLMFQLVGIPNTSDLAFNSTDLNASAIDRKFYVMNMATQSIVEKLKKAYLRRWELIFSRINIKKNTKFDFRDIVIDLPKNLPSSNDEMIDSMMKLQGIISDQTIIEKLGYDYLDEKAKMEEEGADAIQRNLEKMKALGGRDGETGNTGQSMEESGRKPDEESGENTQDMRELSGRNQ